MERILSLVLDDKGLISLPLYIADNIAMDKYTTKNFENSEQIREKFKFKIDRFLLENQNYLNKIRESSNREFNGRIVLLQANKDDDTQFDEKRVLYKKHLIAFKTMCSDRRTMQKFADLEKIGCNTYGLKRLTSDFVLGKIRSDKTFRVKDRVGSLVREIKKDDDFYEILRVMVKAYKIERKNRPELKTIDSIYSEYLQNRKKKFVEKSIIPKEIESVEEVKEKEFCKINGVSYRTEERELFDLDDNAEYEDDDIKPDGLGKK